MNRDELIAKIAREECSVDTLKTHGRDGLDFHDISVRGLKSALERAYKAGPGAEAGEDYRYMVITHDRQRYSITNYCDGRAYINSIHPYDDADYHWVVAKGDNYWTFYIGSPGRLACKLHTDDLTLIFEKLAELDKGIRSKIAYD